MLGCTMHFPHVATRSYSATIIFDAMERGRSLFSTRCTSPNLLRGACMSRFGKALVGILRHGRSDDYNELVKHAFFGSDKHSEDLKFSIVHLVLSNSRRGCRCYVRRPCPHPRPQTFLFPSEAPRTNCSSTLVIQ